MDIVYTLEEVNNKKVSCFLAGPTPRDKDVSSWRGDAIKLFSKYGFKGTLYVPEFRDKSYYDVDTGFNEMRWDQQALESATCVMFWIPRSDDMLGLSTNVEFGYLLNKGNFIYGRPDGAFRCEFLDFLYKDKLNREYNSTLEDTVLAVIDYLGGCYE